MSTDHVLTNLNQTRDFLAQFFATHSDTPLFYAPGLNAPQLTETDLPLLEGMMSHLCFLPIQDVRDAPLGLITMLMAAPSPAALWRDAQRMIQSNADTFTLDLSQVQQHLAEVYHYHP